MAGGLTGADTSKATAMAATLVYDVAGDSWSTVTGGAAPTGKHVAGCGAVATVSGVQRFYVVGGYDFSSSYAPSKDVDYFDISKSEGWQSRCVGATKHPRCSTADARRLCRHAGTWATAAPMPTARGDLGCASLSSGKVLALGGYTGSAYTAVVEALDVASGAWTALASMQHLRGDFAVAVLPGDQVAVLGGQVTVTTAQDSQLTAATLVAQTAHEVGALAGLRVRAGPPLRPLRCKRRRA